MFKDHKGLIALVVIVLGLEILSEGAGVAALTAIFGGAAAVAA